MQFKDAAYRILQQAAQPLHYNEITERALAQNLLTTLGQTPHASGEVLFNGQTYPTPSTAAKLVANTWKEVNGWAFWRYLDPTTGDLQKIGILRPKKS